MSWVVQTPGGKVSLDDRAQQVLLARYTPEKVDKILTTSASAGARAAAEVVRSAAPVGTSSRPSQFYRREGGQHGQMRRSVRAGRIRKRGYQNRTVGYVVGPMGKWGFTRHWIAKGTGPHLIRRGRGGRISHPGARRSPWFDRVSTRAMATARAKSEAVLMRYAKGD